MRSETGGMRGGMGEMVDALTVALPTTETKSLDPPEIEEDGPPWDPRVVIDACLLALAVLTVMYFAKSFVLPIILAIIIKLVLQPAMRVLENFHIPRALAATLLMLAAFGAMVGIASAMSGPAVDWARKLPDGIQRLESQLKFLTEPIQSLQNFLKQFDHGGASDSGAVASIETTLLSGTQSIASGLFETTLLLFFLLNSGDTFLRRMVEIVPGFREKRRIVALSNQIEENISAYLVTVSLMNVAVGVATAAAAWAFGLPDAMLWGSLAFLLNYLPIIGPVIGVALVLFAGILTFDEFWRALLPAGTYLVIHFIEGETVTPMLLARRFTLNPVIVVMSIMFWFWFWGVPGAVLAVPLIAIAKIICDDVKPLNPIGHFLEG